VCGKCVFEWHPSSGRQLASESPGRSSGLRRDNDKYYRHHDAKDQHFFRRQWGFDPDPGPDGLDRPLREVRAGEFEQDVSGYRGVLWHRDGELLQVESASGKQLWDVVGGVWKGWEGGGEGSIASWQSLMNKQRVSFVFGTLDILVAYLDAYIEFDLPVQFSCILINVLPALNGTSIRKLISRHIRVRYALLPVFPCWVASTQASVSSSPAQVQRCERLPETTSSAMTMAT